MRCAVCGMIRQKMSEIIQHFEIKHPGQKLNWLLDDTSPSKGFWWCTAPPRGANKRKLYTGTQMLNRQPEQRKVIEFIKINLNKGFKVPYAFQHYGIVAVNEMHQDKEHLSKRKKLRFPSNALLEDYEELGAETFDYFGTSPDSAPQITNSPNK